MSFTFQWPRFSDQFHADAIQLLENALNKGNKPPVIADKIEVVELEMGTQPPELEIRDIGELTVSQFRGIFRFTYAGDAHIVLRTKVQANPLFHKKADIHQMGGSRGMLAANQPLVVPMLLRLSNFKLNSYVVLVVSKPKGITLVFKTDPLQNVDINSTFDSITVIQKFIQKEIEGQLRQMFREDLPVIIHRLSQQWVKRSTTVEAPYLRPPLAQRADLETMSNPEVRGARLPMSAGLRPSLRSQASLPPLIVPRHLTSFARNEAGSADGSYPASEYSFDTRSMNERLSERPPYSSLRNFNRQPRGLADLSEERSDYDPGDEAGSFDVINWEDTVSEEPTPESVNVTEYETVPAVGGGFITRPRVYHSSSLLHGSSGSLNQSNPSSAIGLTAPALQRLSQDGPYVRFQTNAQSAPSSSRRQSWDTSSFPGQVFHDQRVDIGFSEGAYRFQMSSTQYTSGRRPRRNTAGDQSDNPYFNDEHSASTSFDIDPQSSDGSSGASSSAAQLDSASNSVFDRRTRRDSVSSRVPPSTYSDDDGERDPDAKIVLRPGFNSAIAQLSLLNRSNNTLSPYTRTLEHVTTRSAPPRTVLSTAPRSTTIERVPVKAKRKRVYRLGGPKPPETSNSKSPDPSVILSTSTPPDIDPSEVDLYFRSRDDIASHLDSPHSSHTHRRSSYRNL